MSDTPSGAEEPFRPGQPSGPGQPADPIPAPGQGEPPPAGSTEQGFSYTPPEVEPKWNGMAIASLVLGIAGLFIFGIPLGLAAVVAGILAIQTITREPGRHKGKGLAIAGTVIGAIDVGLVLAL